MSPSVRYDSARRSRTKPWCPNFSRNSILVVRSIVAMFGGAVDVETGPGSVPLISLVGCDPGELHEAKKKQPRISAKYRGINFINGPIPE